MFPVMALPAMILGIPLVEVDELPPETDLEAMPRVCSDEEAGVDRDAALARLEELRHYADREAAACLAEEVICDLLRDLGYGDVADAFDAVPRL